MNRTHFSSTTGKVEFKTSEWLCRFAGTHTLLTISVFYTFVGSWVISVSQPLCKWVNQGPYYVTNIFFKSRSGIYIIYFFVDTYNHIIWKIPLKDQQMILDMEMRLLSKHKREGFKYWLQSFLQTLLSRFHIVFWK